MYTVHAYRFLHIPGHSKGASPAFCPWTINAVGLTCIHRLYYMHLFNSRQLANHCFASVSLKKKSHPCGAVIGAFIQAHVSISNYISRKSNRRKEKIDTRAVDVVFPLCIQIVKEYERAIIFRLGRILRGGAKGPGQNVSFSRTSMYF